MDMSLDRAALTPPSPAAPRAQQLPLPHVIGRALCTAWSSGLLPEPALNAETLIGLASAREGTRPDPGSWRDALDVLVEDLRDSAALNPLGRTIAHGQIVKIVRQRIRAAHLWAREPQILDVPVAAPVVILGHMRSGTTRLQRLLACDARFAFTRLHETLNPLGGGVGALASAAAVRTLLQASNPQVGPIHPTSPRAAEEEFGLHAFAVHGAMFEAQWHVPRFARWCEQRDCAEVYAEFRRLVQTLRWRRRDAPSRIQLLKAPQFMQDLEALLDAFPGARLLWIERDLGQVVASSASLVWHQQRIQSDRADPLRAGREWLRKTELRQGAAAEAVRRKSAVPLLRIRYGAMNADWRTELSRIYDFLGLPLSDALAARMQAVAASRAHHGHHYTREQFGLKAKTRVHS
jgi:hypothetical protein